MLQKATWTWGLFVLLIGTFWVFTLCFSMPDALPFSKDERKEQKAFQEKQGVSKELWLSQTGKQQVHYSLSSESSSLSLSQKENKCTLVETLRDCEWRGEEGVVIHAKQGELSGAEHSFTGEGISLVQQTPEGEQTVRAEHLSYEGELLCLEKNVSLSSSSLGNAECGRAELNPRRSEGVLLGGRAPVALTRKIIDRQGVLHSLALSCPKISFSEETLETPSETNFSWDNSLFFSGGKALFHKGGIFYLFPSDETKKCLCHGEFGSMSADRLSIDVEKPLAHFVRPRGTALLPWTKGKKVELSFHAEHLYLLEQTKEAVLEGNAFLIAPLMGTLDAANELRLLFSEDEIEKISTKGSAHLTTLRGEILSYNGPSFFNQKTGEMVIHGEQVHYCSPTYELEGESFSGTLAPLSFTMEGNLSFLDKSPKHPLQCAIAEKATYDSVKELLILSASPPSAVLFWDKKENLHLRAPEIHICRAVGKEKVEAKGVASLILSSAEKALLEGKFAHE